MGTHTCTWKVIVCLVLNNVVWAGKNHSDFLYKENIETNLVQLDQIPEEKLKPETKPTHGASRFDVGGILTAFGVKQGASIFALVLFPILFPLMILLGLAMFIISVFGMGGIAAVGRRSDIIANSNGDSFGYSSLLPGGNYKLGRDGLIPLTNREGLDHTFDAVESDACMEKFVCKLLLDYGISQIIGKKGTLEILRELNVMPLIMPNSFSGRKSRKVWKCSSLKCNWDGWMSPNAVSTAAANGKFL